MNNVENARRQCTVDGDWSNEQVNNLIDLAVGKELCVLLYDPRYNRSGGYSIRITHPESESDVADLTAGTETEIIGMAAGVVNNYQHPIPEATDHDRIVDPMMINPDEYGPVVYKAEPGTDRVVQRWNGSQWERINNHFYTKDESETVLTFIRNEFPTTPWNYFRISVRPIEPDTEIQLCKIEQTVPGCEGWHGSDESPLSEGERNLEWVSNRCPERQFRLVKTRKVKEFPIEYDPYAGDY